MPASGPTAGRASAKSQCQKQPRQDEENVDSLDPPELSVAIVPGMVIITGRLIEEGVSYDDGEAKCHDMDILPNVDVSLAGQRSLGRRPARGRGFGCLFRMRTCQPTCAMTMTDETVCFRQATLGGGSSRPGNRSQFSDTFP